MRTCFQRMVYERETEKLWPEKLSLGLRDLATQVVGGKAQNLAAALVHP